MTKKRKPMKPDDAHQAMKRREELRQEIERIRAQGGTVRTDRGGRIISAYRSNVFNLLLERKAITPNQHDAAYRLSVDWAEWKGLAGDPEYHDRVDGGPTLSKSLVTDRMLAAGARARTALQWLSPTSAALVTAFMVATVEEDRPMAWRGIVERSLGERVRDRQTALVVGALEELRLYYESDGTQDRVAA